MFVRILKELLYYGLVFTFLISITACSDSATVDQSVDGDADDDGNDLPEGDIVEEDLEESPSPVDGDTDSDITESSDLESDLDQSESESEADLYDIPEAEEELAEFDVDIEAEEEAEPEMPRCYPDDNPFELFQVAERPEFGPTAYSHMGEITDACLADGFVFAGAKDMEISISYRPETLDKPLAGRMIIADAAAVSGRREPVVFYDQVDEFPLGGFDTTFTLPYSGEYLILVVPRSFSHTGQYSLNVQCTGNCEKRFTRNPIVLVHGMGGFDEALGFLNYFFGVEENLLNQGYDVHVTDTAMFDDSEMRAQQMESQVMGYLTETGASKVNIIAHSQGGLDTRHLISVMGHGPDIAVVAMVAVPNRGVIVGDMVAGTIQGISREVISAIIDFFVDLVDGEESDIVSALLQISVQSMEEEFNPAHPDDPNVVYWSWAGITCGLLEFSCKPHSSDIVSPVLLLTHTLIANGPEGVGSGLNDGMVPLKSAMWGEFIGTIDADHADEIGQVPSGNFDHKQFYRDVANRLYTHGF